MSVTAELSLSKMKSGEGRRIVVIRRANDDFDRYSYVIRLLMEQWRQWSFQVEVTSDAETAVGVATVVIPHEDVTRTPAEYEKSFDRCAAVVNRAVKDISKRRISKNLIRRPGDHDGPVIVKTNLNCGGVAELNGVRDKGRFGRAVLAIARRLPWQLSGMIGPYKNFDHPKSAPARVEESDAGRREIPARTERWHVLLAAVHIPGR